MDAPKKRGRGRPLGSRTAAETPAVKRAREFLELQFEGRKPTAAAEKIAAAWQVAETTIFADCIRHEHRLLAEKRPASVLLAGKKRKTRAIQIKLGRMFLRDYSDIADEFTRELRSAFAEVGRVARECNPASDEWLVLLGTLYITILLDEPTKTVKQN